MALAMIYPEPKRGIHSELKNSTGLGFDKAYKTARDRKDATNVSASASSGHRSGLSHDLSVQRHIRYHFIRNRLRRARPIINKSQTPTSCWKVTTNSSHSGMSIPAESARANSLR